jgi:hypothetical protein
MQQNVNEFLYKVIRSMTFKEDSSMLKSYIDTLLVHHSLSQYSRLYTNYSKWGIYMYPPRKTEVFRWENFAIETKNFDCHFWGILNHFYELPKNQESIDTLFSIDNIQSKILCYDDGIYTVRVIWTLPSSRHIKSYIGYFSIKEIGTEYIVIGFNKFNQ